MKLQTKSGKQLHPIGIGTWNMCSHITDDVDNGYRGVAPLKGGERETIEAIRYSLSKGQNHIDCAELYGGFYTDEVVGRALAGHSREDLFIADKLWKGSVPAGKVRAAVDEMRRKMRVDYLDLLYIHAPWDDAPWQEAIPQIDKLIDEGIVRYFGVSNFTVNQMQEVKDLAKHPIAANQMNFNALHKSEVDKAFRDYCAKNDVAIVAYQPLKRKEVLDSPILQEIARAHGATPTQIALAWLIQLGALPIPKAADVAHIDSNLGALNIMLSNEEMSTIEAT